MRRRTFVRSCAMWAAVGRVQGQGAGAALEEAFRNPGGEARAKTWWHWMNGNISAEGITRDLEALQRVGVGGVQMFQVGSGIAKGPVAFGSPENIELVRHAAREALRLGLEFTTHNCPGWSSSGGPWVTAELSMQTLTWTETAVQGGQTIQVTLKQPATKLNYYRDIIVLAFPAQAGEERPVEELLKGTTSSGEGERPAWIKMEFAGAYEARSISVVSAPAAGMMTLEASVDGVMFRKVCEIAASGGGLLGEGADVPAVANFAAVRAKFFRLTAAPGRRFTEVKLSGAGRVANWAAKASFTGRGFGSGGGAVAAATLAAPEGAPVKSGAVVDITKFMDAQGRLNWTAPAGAWTVLRLGHTTTGRQNGPAPDGGAGLECDKFSAEAYDFHFNHFYKDLLEVMKPLAERGLAGSIIDSFEAGMQNWTARFAEEFRKRRGYELTKYLPAMTGRVMDSAETTDRFLWDMRKTQAELMEENYYARFEEHCRRLGWKCYIEPYEAGNFDEMAVGAHAGAPMGEFWLGQVNHRSVKLAASVAHVNGRAVVAAESFTGLSKWQEYPYSMKTTGDFMYTQGLNQYVFHRYAHQPHPDVKPGMTMGPWGWHFDRTNTWFEQSRTWLEYVTRCQSLLQQGLAVADLLYLAGEDSPAGVPSLEELRPAPPQGHDWDTIDLGGLKRAKIDGGRIVLADGMSYRMLVLRDETATLTLELARRIRDLVQAGMSLLGPKPRRTPGLGTAEGEFRQVVEDVWGEVNGTSVRGRACGKGYVYHGVPLRAILDKLVVKPDFECTSKSGDAPVNYIHRKAGNAEVYFVANRRRRVEDVVATFRVDGKRPELWDAATGEMTQAPVYEMVEGRVRMPLRLEPAGSVFVVFRGAAPPRRIHAVAKQGVSLSTQPFPDPQAGLQRAVSQSFAVSVWVKPDLTIGLPQVGSTGGGLFGALAGTSYVFYPPAGETLYGAGHAACGLAAGRNGVVVYERTAGSPVPVLVAPAALAGWTHVAVVYHAGAPAVYVNGRAAGQGRKSAKVVHPGVGESFQTDGASYFMGHMSDAEVHGQGLSDERIRQMAGAGAALPFGPPVFEPGGRTRPEMLIWEDGRYTVTDSAGKAAVVEVSGLGAPLEIQGPWRVAFPPELGAPPEITLAELVSLHKHAQAGVKYFSGTATYRKRVSVPAVAKAASERLFLDLGWVEVLAEVRVNGKEAGAVWKPPFRLDITALVRAGDNDLEIRVTNQWTNRLIGDEQLPAEYEYGAAPGAGGPGGLFAAGIRTIPEWYAQGRPRPKGARVAFTTWKHYSKEEGLLEAGLLGPVRLRKAVRRAL